MRSEEIRKKFISFFKNKEHIIVPSSSLLPEDETVLLTSAGMQQFVPHLSGKRSAIKDFGSIHLASVQKCFRSADIEEIGDDTHHTFFEMLGNWSIGEDEHLGYFKEKSIDFALDFFVKELGLSKEKLYVTVFEGSDEIPTDDEAVSIWKEKGFPSERIMKFDAKDNFWGPTSSTGPCGPCSEIHYDRGERYGCKDFCGPNCDECKRFVELWNLVFMEYNKNEDGSYSKLPQRNVDTGIGFERLVALLANKDSAYETDLFLPAINKIEQITEKNYEDHKKEFRVIADHVRGSVFLIADGVLPSNKEAGYVLRRIIRRAVRYGMKVGVDSLEEVAQVLVDEYKEFYPELAENHILPVIKEEEERFGKTLKEGLKELRKLKKEEVSGKVSSKDAFYIYQTFGFPLEMIQEELSGEDLSVDEKEFEEEFHRHQQISKKGAEEKFGGLSKKAGDKEVMLHTATHLLHQALREVLGDHVRQMGSDINEKRLRFDFSHSQKMSKEELEEVEMLVNDSIKRGLDVTSEDMNYEEAVSCGALAFFKDEYPETVTVYRIGEFSTEVCGGPHVKNLSDLGLFRITKEESSSSGVRRIKATLV